MDDETKGRMMVLEMLAMTSLGIVMASAGNDPDMSKARAILDFIRSTVGQRADEEGFSPEAKASARHYADDLLSQALENLKLLRNGGR